MTRSSVAFEAAGSFEKLISHQNFQANYQMVEKLEVYRIE
jgi:hypothetical protein